jgi:iron complex outermembrane recepter protein
MICNKSRLAVSALFLSASIMTLATSAVAQAGPAPAPPAGATGAPTGLEDIVVTARKRTESLQNVPVAVTAYSPAQIQRYDISSIDRVAAATPNLTVGRATIGSGAQISLRGIGSPASALGIEQSVSVIVDGVYYGNGRVLNEGFFDLASIEVLKGPQALFYGKNATAGVISINTALPTSHFEGSTKVGYEFNAKQPYIEQILSGPLTDTLGYRLALRGSDMFGGYSENLATPVTYTTTDLATGKLQTHTAPAGDHWGPQEKEFVGRLTLQWKPGEHVTDTLKVSGNLDHVNDPAWNNLIYSCASGFSTVQPGVPCKRDWKFYHNALPADIAATFPYAPKDGHLYNKYKSFQVTNNLEYKTDALTLTSTTNFQIQQNQWLSDSDYQQRVGQIFVGSHERWRAFSEEARMLTSLDFPVNVMIGLFYQRTNLYANQVDLVSNLQNSAAAPYNQYLSYSKISTTAGETMSPYAQAIWKPLQGVEIDAGARYTYETKNNFFIHPYVQPGQPYRTIPINLDQAFHNVAPEVTASYKPNAHINIYGGYKTGYKSGGFSNESSYTTSSAASDLAFAPEKVRGFEGGVKATLLDNQLRLGLALFTYKYTNLQVDFFEATTFRYVTTNAGSARTKGIELTGEYAPRAVPGLTLHGAVNFDKAYYIDFVAPCVTGQTPAQGCNTASPFGGLVGQDLAGKPTANAPRWTAALGGSYEAAAGHGLRFGLTVDGRYSDSYNGSPFHDPIAIQPKYINLDASLYLKSDHGWDVSLIGKNLTNQFVISGALDSPATGARTGTPTGVLADQRGFANLPRTVQLQVTYHY